MTTATKSRPKSGMANKTTETGETQLVSLPPSGMDALIRKFNKARTVAGLTVNQLSDHSGVSTPTLHQFFSGRGLLKPPGLNKVAKILGIDEDEAVEVFIQNQCDRIRRKYS